VRLGAIVALELPQKKNNDGKRVERDHKHIKLIREHHQCITNSRNTLTDFFNACDKLDYQAFARLGCKKVRCNASRTFLTTSPFPMG
jgi:hypothetical protein